MLLNIFVKNTIMDFEGLWLNLWPILTRVINYLFHGGSPYHIETSPFFFAEDWFRELRHKKSQMFPNPRVDKTILIPSDV